MSLSKSLKPLFDNIRLEGIVGGPKVNGLYYPLIVLGLEEASYIYVFGHWEPWKF